MIGIELIKLTIHFQLDRFIPHGGRCSRNYRKCRRIIDSWIREIRAICHLPYQNHIGWSKVRWACTFWVIAFDLSGEYLFPFCTSFLYNLLIILISAQLVQKSHKSTIFILYRYTPISADTVTQAFRTIDREKKGTIEMTRLREYLIKEGEPFSPEEVDEMFNCMLSKDDGLFHYEEYIRKAGRLSNQWNDVQRTRWDVKN